MIREPKMTYFARASIRQSSYKKTVEDRVVDIKEYLQYELTINSDQSVHYKTHMEFEQYLSNDHLHSLPNELD